MKRKFLTKSNCIAALILIILSFCLAAFIGLTVPRASYADDEGESSTVEIGEEAFPSIAGWQWSNFDEEVNVIKIPDALANEDITFQMYYVKEPLADGITTPDKIEWLRFTEVIDGVETNKVLFSLVDGAMPDYVIAKLKTLDAGDYCLISSYGDQVHTSPFQVFSIRNTITTLTIDQWTWGEYNYIKNIISVNVAHGWDKEGNYDTSKSDTISKITYTVCLDDSGKLGSEIEKLTDFNIESNGRVIETDKRIAFGNLSAGKYWLVARTNDNHKNLLDTTMRIQFTVAKASNPWTTTPSILQWTWGEYDSKTNLISGRSKYGTVEFGVYSDIECKTNVIPSFTQVTDEVAAKLEGLHVGTYYLKAQTDSSDNYEECRGVIPFTVQKAHNTWTVPPYAVSWKYGQYDKELNVIRGEAEFGTTALSVYTDAECTDAVEFAQAFNGSKTAFALGEDGLVPDYVKDKLSALGKGTYYLLAVIDGTSDYSGINDGTGRKPVPFEVIALDNYWTEAPGLLSWSEGHFSAFDIDKNLTGRAKAGDVKFTVTNSDNKVLFIITTENGKIASVQSGDGETLKVSDLNSLSVGSYELLAEVEGNENYSGLSCKATFAVSEDSVALSGIIAAVITFAILDVAAAGACIALIIIRRKKVQAQLQKMIIKDTSRG